MSTRHSVFGAAAPPGDYGVFNAAPSIQLGQTFYHSGLPEGSKIAGGRLWVPAGAVAGNVEISLYVGVKDAVNNLDSAPVQTKVVPFLPGQWNQAVFDVPQDVPAAGVRWMIAYQMPGDTFISTGNLRAVGDPIPAADGSPFALGPYFTPAPSGPVRDRYFQIGGGAVDAPAAEQGGYGIDTLVDIPDAGPPNVAPTVSAGPDQQVDVGELVTLQAVANDPDGTVIGYTWTQAGGLPVALAGAGASRTFTPAVAGPRVFTVVAVDDDGAESAPDSVTIVVVPPPADPGSALDPQLWASPPDSDPWLPPLNTAGLESFLRERGLGSAVSVVDGPEISNDPGAQLVVTWLPGAGLQLEGMLSTPGFQVRTIGPQGNREAARELAERVDAELVLRDRWPAFIGGRYVVTVRRAGGEPAHDRNDTAGRAHYVCTYLADVEAQ